MPRIIIVGSSCAGKSTLAARLSDQLGIPHIQLDALHWKPNWVERDTASFLRLLREQIEAHPSWIVDGNYSKSHAVTWPHADVIIWLNYAFPVVCWRALRRTVRRVVRREVLYAGNTESFRRAFLSHDSILLWVLTNFHRRRRTYRVRLQAAQQAGVRVVELRHPRDAEHMAERVLALLA